MSPSGPIGKDARARVVFPNYVDSLTLFRQLRTFKLFLTFNGLVFGSNFVTIIRLLPKAIHPLFLEFGNILPSVVLLQKGFFSVTKFWSRHSYCLGVPAKLNRTYYRLHGAQKSFLCSSLKRIPFFLLLLQGSTVKDSN